MRVGRTTTVLFLLLVIVAHEGLTSANKTHDGEHQLDLEIDSCERDEHCLHGGTCTALNEQSPKTCSCPEGYNGLRCEQHCPLQCSNGGRCYSKAHEYVEKERKYEDFTGWDKRPTNAEPEDLAKAARQEEDSTDFNDFACHCRGLFMGYLCDIPYENCGDMTRCFYGGECQPDSTTEPCICAPGYTGKFCQLYSGDNDPAGIVQLPQPQASQQSSSKKPWPLILGSIGLGSVLGIVGFIWKERRSRFYSNWLVSSPSGSSSSMSLEDASTRTFVNVI